jgi:hypothetical protein
MKETLKDHTSLPPIAPLTEVEDDRDLYIVPQFYE